MSGAAARGLRPLEWAALGVAAAAFLVLFAVPMRLEANSDATEYLAFADAIRSGDVLVPAAQRPLPRALGTRTPGYPLLVAIAELAWPEPVGAVRALHVLLGLVSLLYVPIALRREVPVWLVAASVLFVQWRMQFYFTTAITEWTCFNLLLVLFAASARLVDEPSFLRLAGLGLLCSFLILVRPAMVVVAFVPPLLALVQRRLGRLPALAAASAPFVLLLLWSAFNVYRIGSFTLTPFSGMNVFGVAAILGGAEARPGDRPELATLIREVNARRLPGAGETLDSPRMRALGTANVYNWNVHQVGEAIRRHYGWDWVLYDELLLEFGGRVIRSRPGAYAAYVGRELAKLRGSLPLLIPALLLGLFWLHRGAHRGLATALLALAGLHVLHLVLCALVEVVIPRYESLTWEALLAGLLVTAGTSLRRVRPTEPSFSA